MFWFSAAETSERISSLMGPVRVLSLALVLLAREDALGLDALLRVSQPEEHERSFPFPVRGMRAGAG